ncbi:MAG: hypothetical protein D6706_15500 [Chloroflexi bacterium]|nr:MAG: hypothetical protein D6706_15500 [Chloroflexota bacterium]
MLKLPPIPASYTTRHLECISCREQFIVAEAYFPENQDLSHPGQSNGITQHSYRLPGNNNLEINLRTQENPTHRTVLPFTRAEPHTPPLHQRPRSDTYVNCPRCGVDNRNWMQISSLLETAKGKAAHFPLQSRIYWIALGVGIFAGLIYSLFALASTETPEMSTIFLISINTLILVAGILFTTSLITRYLLAMWRQTYWHMHKSKLNKALTASLSPTIQTGIFWTLIIAVGVPMVLSVILRLSNYFMSLFTRLIDSSFLDLLFPLEPTVLIFWILFVGLSGLFTTLVGQQWVISMVNQISQQLPRPIFMSVANMTRVAIWEAKRSLKIAPEILENIEWTHVQRNHTGGITLVGICRDTPEFDGYGRLLGQAIRAQRYIINTDIWCRILSIELQFTHAPHALNTPRFTQSPRPEQQPHPLNPTPPSQRYVPPPQAPRPPRPNIRG